MVNGRYENAEKLNWETLLHRGNSEESLNDVDVGR